MSRVGKKPIPVPKGVKLTIGSELTVEGPKGKQTVPIPAGIALKQTDGVLEILREYYASVPEDEKVEVKLAGHSAR